MKVLKVLGNTSILRDVMFDLRSLKFSGFWRSNVSLSYSGKRAKFLRTKREERTFQNNGLLATMNDRERKTMRAREDDSSNLDLDVHAWRVDTLSSRVFVTNNSA